MKIVFDAANALEAHMLQDLLAMQGIKSQIQGEHLQSGVGELPAMGLVKVSVDEADYAKAQEIIAQWESQEPNQETVQASRRQPGGYLGMFLLGVAVGAGVVYCWIVLLTGT